jgi:hypothetical protein
MTDAVNVFSVTVACDNTVDLPSAFPARQSPKVAGQRKYIQVFGTADSGFRTVLDLKTGINRRCIYFCLPPKGKKVYESYIS